LIVTLAASFLLACAGPALAAEKPAPATQPEQAWKPIRAQQPPIERSGWSITPVDSFVRVKQEGKGLKSAPPADRRTLIRRVTFDIVGLPPTPLEISDFLADQSPDAFDRLVDRLLASPGHGEQWGRHWLDVARYADSGGFEADLPYKYAWQYRDYVIRSLNADKPADRFIQEQVAGDELWPGDDEARIATGLYCVGPAVTDATMVAGQLEYEWLTDAADTTGAVFLGLTFGCARCHDHKYDPITQRDYYAMQANFAASDRAFPEKFRLTSVKAINGLLSDAPVPNELLSDPRSTVKTEDQALFGLFHRKAPVVVRRLDRGELSKAAEMMEPAVPAALACSDSPSFADAKPFERRAALARWLTSRENPLTARVLANRIWGWHFGQPIVRTPNDFGLQGESATHPELLDWLAGELLDHGWNLKRLHRTIVCSQTYRQASSGTEWVSQSSELTTQNTEARTSSNQGIDAQNRLLWHFPRRRLTGEELRDAMLTTAGTLNETAFGPAVVPPLASDELTGLFDAKGKWPVTKDVSQHTRRSVYILVRRTFIYPLFAAFDPPEVMVSCPRRSQTIVPTQALALMNSPIAREQATALAQRLRGECGGDSATITERLFQLALARPPTGAERARVKDFLAGSGEVSPSNNRLADLCLAIFNSNEFVHLE
jgi:hypothetical protein